jgi:DNA recombination protein RmuC
VDPTVTVGLVIGALAGLACGVALGLLAGAGRQARLAAESQAATARLAEAQSAAAALRTEVAQSQTALSDARSTVVRLEAEIVHLHRSVDERAAESEADRQRLIGTFAELSGQALQQNSQQFLTLADARLREAHEAARGDLNQRQQAIAQLLTPLQESLQRYESGLRQLELDRRGAYDGLREQVKALNTSHERLQKETGSLVTALRTPQTRGRWGELQLRRVVELAGMVEHCDFEEQVTADSDDGRFRPDLVVSVAGGAQIVVDAKVPLEAFLRAAESDDEDERKRQFVAHARQLRTHVDQLAKKEYWKQFDPSPDLVVAFIPGDPLLAAASEHDPGLVEHALANQVLLATPTTLIALLRTIAYGWQQDQLAENAREVQRHGAELYDRLRVLGTHLSKLSRGLTTSVEAFNETIGSLESRVLVTARRFPEMGVVGPGASELVAPNPVNATPRLPQAPELLGGPPPPAGEETESRAPLAALPGLLEDLDEPTGARGLG